MTKKQVIEKTTQNGMLLLQPYLGMGFVGFLGIMLHLISRAGLRTDILLALVMATLALSAFTWKSSQSRRDFGRHHAVFTMAASGGWLIAAVAWAPWEPYVALAWLLGGITLALSWNIRTTIRTTERDDSMQEWFKENGLEGARMRITAKTADIIKATVSLKPGRREVDDLQRLKGRLASLFRAPPNGVRINPDPENAAKAYLTVVRRDMLKAVTPYSWEFRGEYLTPNDPITVGVYEDASPAQFSLHSPMLGSAHMLVQGANGSGKSEFAKVVFAEIFKREELELWIVDTVKGSQTLGIIRDAADWVIDNEKLANLLFKKFRKIIKDRADYLGSKRLSKWEPGCGLSFVYLHIEEASGLVADNPAFIKMMETARSVGVQITTSLQRASFVSIDTQARAQFAAVACFGVMDNADAAFALPDEVIAAGANPAVWRNSKPGYCYLVHPTVDDDRWNMPLRTFKIEDDVLEEAARNRVQNELDPITLGALGDLYKATVDEDDEESEDAEEEDEFEEPDWELEDLPVTYEDSFLEFDNDTREVSPAEAKKILDDRLEELRKAGNGSFNAAELGDVLVNANRSRAWLHKQLQRLVDEGILQKEGFSYNFN